MSAKVTDEVLEGLKSYARDTVTPFNEWAIEKAPYLIEQQARIIADNEKTLEDFKVDFTNKYEQQEKEIEIWMQRNVTLAKSYETLLTQNEELKAREFCETASGHRSNLATLRTQNERLRKALGEVVDLLDDQKITGAVVEEAKALLAEVKPPNSTASIPEASLT